ncbi:hypothetical protein [Parasphingorhabdus pacifica]
MAAPDPVDVRLLSVVAETGRAAVHEIAGRLGMDVREVAARLASLSTTGLLLVVGVECDPNGLRSALAAANAYQQASGSYPVQTQPPGQVPNQGPPAPGHSGAHHGPAPSGSHPVPPPQSGSYPVPAPTGWPPAQHPSGNHPQPSGQTPVQSGPQPYPSQPYPSQPYPSQPYRSQPYPSQPYPAQAYPAQAAPQGDAPPADPASTWGPAGSASWTRGDQQAGAQPPQSPPPQSPPPQPAPVPAGTIGSKLDVEGYEGERITIQLVEVVDPADFLYTAAGYQLPDGERAVIVHTEVTNRGSVPFAALPDEYLELIATDGSVVSKAPVSLSSRPPHQTGLAAGATAGGHTIYVLPEPVDLAAVRWMPRRGDDRRTLTWDITEL